MRLSLTFKILFVSLWISAVAFADGITPASLSANGGITRDRHLSEIRDIMRGGRGGYIDLGFYYLPSPHQTPLLSEYGEHDGFAFNHHLALFGAGEVAKNKHLGAMLWFDRSGWDGEDFFFFPQYNNYSLQRSVVTWGLSLTDAKRNWTIAAGMQHQNVEHVGRVYPHEDDSLLYSWAHLRWNRISAQGNFYRSHFQSARLSLDLESRNIYGGKSSGWSTYLPNVEFAFYNTKEDSLLITWEQNLYDQRLYGEVTFDFPDKEFYLAALKFYPDPSRMIGFEATCLRRQNSDGSHDLLWGGAVDLLFARLAYNAAYDYEHFFGAKGTFIVEFKFTLATIDGFLFNRGAAKRAPMETNVIKQSEKALKNEGLNSKNSAPKTIEAKGIRYEKTSAPQSSQGGL